MMLNNQEQGRGGGRYEVALIGAGPGGYVAAIKAAHLGLKTVVIEERDVGGTCLNRGCIPTKTLLHAAELYEEIQQAQTFGLSVDHAHVDYEGLRKRKVSVCDTLRSGVEALLDANGVDVVRGHGRILSPKMIEVAPVEEDQPSDSLIIETENIIIATGTTPDVPDIPGMDLPGVHNSDSILEEIPKLDSLMVLGGGVVGVEFASIYVGFGTEVTLLVTSDRALRALEKELGQSLAMEMKKKGASVITRASVKRIEQLPGGALRAFYTVKGEEQYKDMDAVLVAKGRSGDVAGVLGEGLELECSRGKIAVDERMRTSIDGIYAIGDISTAGPELAHAASAEGILAVCDIAGVKEEIRLDLVPSCVYTSPEIATVGISEAEAKEAGIAVKIGKYPLAGNGKTVITNQGRSFIKIIADEDDKVIGAHLMCARATDMIGELTLGIATGLSVEDMLLIARPHPTFEEAIGEALESVLGTSIHSMPRKKR